VTNIIPLTPTHYSEIRLRNNLVPWNLHALMAGLFSFDRGFQSLIPDREILPSARHQLIHSHSFGLYFDTFGLIEINGDFPRTC
jgi:hypothetical protein